MSYHIMPFKLFSSPRHPACPLVSFHVLPHHALQEVHSEKAPS